MVMDTKAKVEYIFNTIKQHIFSIFPEIQPEHITLESSLHDLGANSIDRADIIVNTLADLNLRVPLVTFAQAKNIEELAGLMAGFYKI
jgi:polyketide biosynthesis acyl carrier protein